MKKQENQSDPCFECDEGVLEAFFEDHTARVQDGRTIVVPQIPMFRCNHCGDAVIGEEGNRMIDDAIKKETRPISAEDIQAFLDKHDFTQNQASEITGLGEKNISRWLSGRVRPSVSVSNYFRVLLESKDAVSILKKYQKQSLKSEFFPSVEKQPDDDEKFVLGEIDYPQLVSLELVKKSKSPKEKRSEICRLFHCKDLLEFGERANQACTQIAAFRDNQKKSNISGGAWIMLGEQKAKQIRTNSYSRESLEKAVEQLIAHLKVPPQECFKEIQKILVDAGVALVCVPNLKKSAFRGCTRLLSPEKAVIIHCLKHRNFSQFWLVLFHEIAHLLLHIESPNDTFLEYEDKVDDHREQEADEWAMDRMLARHKRVAFIAQNAHRSISLLKIFAEKNHVHTALAAEMINKTAEKELFKYSHLTKSKLFPRLTDEEVGTMCNLR